MISTEKFPDRRAAVLCVLGALLFFLYLDWPGSFLFDPDESRYAEIPREMMVSGDWLKMRLNDSVYFEKPPLLYWMNAASMSVFGETPWAARLAARLSCVGVVVLLWSGVGPWSALVYLSSILPFALGRINITDGPLNFGTTFALIFLWRFFADEQAGRSARRAAVGAGFGMAWAVLAKGLIGVVLPGLVVLPWVVLTRQWRTLGRLFISPAPMVVLAITVPIYSILERHNPGYLNFFLIREHFARYTSDIHERPGSLFYFVPVLIGGLMPWSWLVLRNVFLFFREKIRGRSWDSERLFYFLWMVMPVLFFSFSHSKLIPYILPAFPGAAAFLVRRPPHDDADFGLFGTAVTGVLFVLAGIGVAFHAPLIRELQLMPAVIAMSVIACMGGGLARKLEQRRKSAGALLTLTGAWTLIYGALVWSVPRLATHYSDHDLAALSLRLPNATVVCYRHFSHSFPWVFKRPVPVIDFKWELASDGRKSPDLFWSQEEFWKRWESDEKIVAVVMRRGKTPVINDFYHHSRKPMILAHTQHSTLVTNRD